MGGDYILAESLRVSRVVDKVREGSGDAGVVDEELTACSRIQRSLRT